MPSKRWRVVCALREVMLSFWPRMWFSSVDLPTLGRPTMATVPQRKSSLDMVVVLLICCLLLYQSFDRQVVDKPAPLPVAPRGAGWNLHPAYGCSIGECCIQRGKAGNVLRPR